MVDEEHSTSLLGGGGGQYEYIPAVSSISPIVMAAVYVHVFFHMPSEKAAIRHVPKAMVKKMPDPRFG